MSADAGPPVSGWIDSHCHLQMLAPGELESSVDAARAAGVNGFLVPATKREDWDSVLDISHRVPNTWCALGVHPHEASSWRSGDAQRLRSLLGDPRVVAVGECGLDFHYDLSPRSVQIEVMREQWCLALELNLPVVVHNRESNAEMLEMLRRPEHDGLRADFHSYAGGREMAAELIGRGCYLGISGMITFPKADNVREILPDTPHDRFLVETDTPYLAPVPHRGKPNQPAYVVETAKRLSVELGVEPERLARQTTQNFYRLFPRAATGFERRTYSSSDS